MFQTSSIIADFADFADLSICVFPDHPPTPKVVGAEPTGDTTELNSKFIKNMQDKKDRRAIMKLQVHSRLHHTISCAFTFVAFPLF